MPSPTPQKNQDLRRRLQLGSMAPAAAAAALLVGAVAGLGKDPAPAAAGDEAQRPASLAVSREAAPSRAPETEGRRSTALGLPHDGSLVDGVEFPREGPTFFTWDPFRKVSPNPRWRRYGTDRLVRAVLTVLDEFAAANPESPRIGVGDLSRPRGGPFHPTHRSHQNGLDVDVYFPRLDRQERPADGPEGIDHALAQDLVDRFVAAGAEFVFVGPRTNLRGPPGIVQPLENHDRHLHARFPNN